MAGVRGLRHSRIISKWRLVMVENPLAQTEQTRYNYVYQARLILARLVLPPQLAPTGRPDVRANRSRPAA
jgi:hypothetical protein